MQQGNISERQVVDAIQKVFGKPKGPLQRVRMLVMDLDQTVRQSIDNPTGFIKGVRDIELVPGVYEKLWAFNDKGWSIIGVTNQGGVAHGHKTPIDNEVEIERTKELVRRGDENLFTAITACYAMENAKLPGFSYRSLLRKPNYGMLAIIELELSQQNFIADWNNSLVVGDRSEDCELAKNAGIPFEWAHDFVQNDMSIYLDTIPGKVIVR